jgi:hypothetical protein
LAKLDKRQDLVSGSESENPQRALSPVIVRNYVPSPPRDNNPPKESQTMPAPPRPTSAARKSKPDESTVTKDAPSKQLTILRAGAEKDPEDQDAEDQDPQEPIGDAPTGGDEEIIENPEQQPSLKLSSIPRQMPHLLLPAQPSVKISAIPPELLSKRPGGAGFKPSIFGQPAAVAKDPDPDFELDEGADLSILDSDSEECEESEDMNPKSGRGRGGGRGRRGRGRGASRGAGRPVKFTAAKQKVEHPLSKDITTFSPVVPSPTVGSSSTAAVIGTPVDDDTHESEDRRLVSNSIYSYSAINSI